MLSQIFINRSLFFYRLVKPSISEFKSIQQLQYDSKQRQLAMIEEQNNLLLTRNKLYTKEKFVGEVLNTSQEITAGILGRSLNFSAIAPRTLKHFTLEQSLADNKIDYPFLLEELENSLPDLKAVPMHFSYNRGVAIIHQYQWDKKCAYIFNLPEDVSTKQISEKLGLQTVKQIKIEYCRLGLPAYAKVYFNSDEAVTNLVLNNKSYIEVNNRLCFIKTHFDQQKLQLKNRRLVIQNLEQDESSLIFQLSQYGRVTHLDYPTFISRNPSLQQVREKYKHSDTLIKINHHRKDGSIDFEYYPSLEDTMRINTLGKENDLNANIVEKRQKLEAMYKNRMRYAHEVDVHDGRENEVVIKNMGYCIVTYSTTEQAQNCYFNLRFTNPIKLFDSSEQQEFQVDAEYRRRILRFVDSEYQKAKHLQQNNQTLYEKEVESYFNQLSVFDKLVDLQEQVNIIKEKANEMNDDEPENIISYFYTRVNEIKRDLQQKMKSQSFDELAEKELFGRVLPKTDPNQPKVNIEFMQEKRQDLREVLDSDRILKIESKNIKARENFYRRMKTRETRRMGKTEEMTVQEEFDAAQGEQGEQQEVEDDDEYTGKRGFSTIKKRQVAFRKRNALETANYILRYSEYVRNIINEYQGVFSESRFEHNISSTYLNPEGLTLSDGTTFLTQDDLPRTLQCMRSFQSSQQLFNDFWKDYELFKSKSTNLQQFRDNVQNNWVEAIQKYADNGVVKEVYEVEDGEDVEKKVGVLNATVAAFGEEFKVHEDQNGTKVIIKVAKIENICPIDRVARIAQAKRKFDSQHTATARQLQLFEKYKYQIIQSGQIPAEVRKEFNIPQQTTLDDMFEQLAAEAGIYKKDIEMILNLENFTEQQIGEDVGLQLEMEKVRVAQREARASDFAKDPSNIEVRDKEGYFKVSKFRQI